ncbi:MAG: topoisomerase [Francisellaceae bacterium]|nr:topoisomerase [Francisellaceae bacterium]
MLKNLIIVESPAKAKTLKKYLGAQFEVLASYGHVRDLIPKEGAVDPENNFSMKYQIIEKNAKHVDAICEKLKNAKTLYLATDPDREGEAISWHLLELIKNKMSLKGKEVHRVVFYEITKTAVQAAIQQPRELALNLIHAQQARRALDYLVGFNLSPLLWKKIRRGLSAGRVQSPALRMIVEREQEIEKFVSQEYWTIEADLQEQKQGFSAKLIEWNKEKLTQFSITNEAFAKEIKDTIVKEAGGKLLVEKITKSQRKRNPTAPFTTSTLQQEASRKLGFSTQRTMRVAQQLYEGIDIGEGLVGLITYMRTDSVNLANEAIESIRELIADRYGAKAVPETPKVYKTKSKNAQEAHEAIRPTIVTILPENVKNALSSDQYKLYNLIWKRAIASQMIHATFDLVAVDLTAGKNVRFRANGSTITSPGFMMVYSEGLDDAKLEAQDKENILPILEKGQFVNLVEVRGEQHFTEPPPRFTEASIVKTLEEYGIGRPSTYSSIISTLTHREYVMLANKRFTPTDVGKIVNKFLTLYFSQYVDYDFTAKLEDALDAVARGERAWEPLMREFWQPFISLIKTTEENVKRQDVTHEAIEEKCPKCEKPLSIRLGKRGRFIGCTAYPECDYTRSLEEGREESLEPQIVEGRSCPKCEGDLIYKQGRFGKFIGCNNYPKCKHIESLMQAEDTKVVCPECNKGTLVKRKSRFGTFFYSCNQYPDCKYAIKNPPLSENCPSCKWPILTIKTTKRRGVEKACPQKECGFLEPYIEPEVKEA